MNFVGRNELGEFRQPMFFRIKSAELRHQGSLSPAYEFFNRLLEQSINSLEKQSLWQLVKTLAPRPPSLAVSI